MQHFLGGRQSSPLNWVVYIPVLPLDVVHTFVSRARRSFGHRDSAPRWLLYFSEKQVRIMILWMGLCTMQQFVHEEFLKPTAVLDLKTVYLNA